MFTHINTFPIYIGGAGHAFSLGFWVYRFYVSFIPFGTVGDSLTVNHTLSHHHQPQQYTRAHRWLSFSTLSARSGIELATLALSIYSHHFFAKQCVHRKLWICREFVIFLLTAITIYILSLTSFTLTLYLYCFVDILVLILFLNLNCNHVWSNN